MLLKALVWHANMLTEMPHQEAHWQVCKDLLFHLRFSFSLSYIPIDNVTELKVWKCLISRSNLRIIFLKWKRYPTRLFAFVLVPSSWLLQQWQPTCIIACPRNIYIITFLIFFLSLTPSHHMDLEHFVLMLVYSHIVLCFIFLFRWLLPFSATCCGEEDSSKWGPPGCYPQSCFLFWSKNCWSMKIEDRDASSEDHL